MMTKRSLNNGKICVMLLEVSDADDSDYDATFEANESCSDTTDGSDDEIREENEEQCGIQTDEILHDGQIHTPDVNDEEMMEESDEWVDIEGEIEEFAFDENTGLKVDVGNVPNSDQLLSYYNFQRKTILWYKKVFLHILELAVTNAYLVNKEAVKRPKLHFLKFRDSLIEELTCYKENAPKLPTTSDAVSDNLVVPEFDRIEEFHCLENMRCC